MVPLIVSTREVTPCGRSVKATVQTNKKASEAGRAGRPVLHTDPSHQESAVTRSCVKLHCSKGDRDPAIVVQNTAPHRADSRERPATYAIEGKQAA